MTHAREGTRWLVAAASVARSSLLAIARADAGFEPSSPTTCVFQVQELASCLVTHADGAHSIFARVTFTPHSIISRNDTVLADTSTVFVIINAPAGRL